MFPLFTHLFAMKWWDQMPWSSFFECWVLSQLFHSSLSLSLRGSLVPPRCLPLEWEHLHIWGCWYFSQQYWFQLVIPPVVFHMMYSTYKLKKHGDNIQCWCAPFPIWNQSIVPHAVLTVASWPAYRFLRRQVRWSGIPISKNFLRFVVIHTVKGFSVVNEAEVDVFLKASYFLYDPMDVGNLISGSSAFSKSSMYLWMFSVHILLKSSLKGLSIIFLACEMSTVVL